MRLERPDPLTAPDSKVASFDWFPLYYRQLVNSAFWRNATGDVCKISVELWAEAWQQTPAASLPNDDERLAQMAGFGRRSIGDWKAIKKHVMKAWILCADNRWYHKTLARVANEQIEKRDEKRVQWRAKKAAQRAGNVSEDNWNVPEDMPFRPRVVPGDKP
jgi:hypothetical protein